MSLEMYRAQVLDHYKNPRNFGRMEKPDARFRVDNPLCGDEIEVFLKIKRGRIVGVTFEGHGCAISMAAASLLTEFVKGKRLKEVEALTGKDVFGLLGVKVSPARVKCALLALKALKAAAAFPESSP